MTKDELLYVDHILKSISIIEEFLKNHTKENFTNEQIRYDGVLRNLQTMAESTQRLSQSLKDQYPNIRWRSIADFRNVLVHDYLEGRIDSDIIWDIMAQELKPLKIVALEIRDKLQEKPNSDFKNTL